MKAIEAPKTIEPWRIICAAQSEPDCTERGLAVRIQREDIFNAMHRI